MFPLLWWIQWLQRWVACGIGERCSRAEPLEDRVQMVLGIFSHKGVLPFEFEPAHSIGHLLTQHPGELEEAERKGGMLQAPHDHFARVYKLLLPQKMAA